MTMRIRYALLKSVCLPRAFDNKPGWKLDAEGKMELKDGNPIYIQTDGSEMTVESGTIGRLNNEAKTNRERAETAEGKLKVFADIDPAKAREALETVGKLDKKRLIDAGEVDRVKADIEKNYTDKLAEKDKALSEANASLNGLRISNALGQSKFIQERVSIPQDMFAAAFGKNLRVEDGKVVAYDANGNKIYSKNRLSELATVDEALEIIVDNYPNKDQILKAPSTSGSGNNGGGGNRGGSQYMKRSDFDRLNPRERAEAAGKMNEGKLNIVD